MKRLDHSNIPINNIFGFASIIFILFMILGCGGGPKDFDTLSLKPAAIEVPQSLMDLKIFYCPRQSQNVVEEILFLVAIDTSNSNWAQLGESGEVCFKGNDMLNERFNSVKNFLTTKLDEPGINVTVGLVLFGDSADAECSNFFAGNTSPFSSNRTEIIELLDGFKEDLGPNDAIQKIPANCMGATNYKMAIKRLTELRDMHAQNLKLKYPANIDPNSQSANLTTFVNFLSDGAPIVNGVLQNQLEIVKSVLAFRDSGINTSHSNLKNLTNIFSTIFYNKKPVELLPGANLNCKERDRGMPQDLLAAIARIGGGAALVQTIPSLDDLYVDPSQIVFSTREIQAYNTNARWIIHPQTNKVSFVLDTDADGISDVEELIFGSDPFIVDSNSNGIHDGHELNLFGKPLQNIIPNCTNSIAKDTDNDGLNDCLEELYKTDIKLSDSDGDGLSDFYATFYGIPGTLFADLDADQDGKGNVQEAAFDATPAMFDNSLIDSELIAQTYSYTPIDDLEGLKGCSEVNITNFRVTPGQKNLKLGLSYYSSQNFGGTQQHTRAEVQLQIPNKYCLHEMNIPATVCDGTGMIPMSFEGDTSYEYPKQYVR